MTTIERGYFIKILGRHFINRALHFNIIRVFKLQSEKPGGGMHGSICFIGGKSENENGDDVTSFSTALFFCENLQNKLGGYEKQRMVLRCGGESSERISQF